MSIRRAALAALVAVSLTAAACDDDSSGERLVFSETVCQQAQFLRMTVGERTQVVLDNSTHSEEQKGLTVRLGGFPVAVSGDLPPDSFIADPFSNIRLTAAPGEESSVTVSPTFSGNYRAICGATVGTQSFQIEIPIQIEG